MVTEIRELAGRIRVYADAVLKIPEPPRGMVEDMRAAARALGLAAQVLADEGGPQQEKVSEAEPARQQLNGPGM